MPNFLSGAESLELTSFGGPTQITGNVDGPQCLAARNMDFEADQPITRRGFAEAFDPNEGIRTIYSWVQSQYNRLLRLNLDASVVSRDLNASTEVEVIPTVAGAIGMICAQAGYRIYMAFYKAFSGSPGMVATASPCKIWDGTFLSGDPVVDNAFPAAIPATDFTVLDAETAPGDITAGTHYFGALAITYNGATPPPSPTSAGAFAPFSIVATGGMNLQITLDPTTVWPDYVDGFQLIMTTATNPNRWFIVPGIVGVGGRGSALTVTFTIDFDDATLMRYEEILPGTGNDYFAVVSGATAPQPHCILGYSTRMVYLYEALGPDGLSLASYLAISEPANFQFVTASAHILQLPEFRTIITAFVIGDVLYICGPSYTYAFSDNGLTPIKWAQPRLVSGAIGSTYVEGVLANSVHGYAWVADNTGLFYLTGLAYPDLPASYYQSPTWSRINWNASPDALKIIEDSTNRKVLVKAPLDGATNATHWLVWDYTQGLTPDRIRFCGLWDINEFDMGGCASVLNPDTSKVEFWAARLDAGNVLRQRLRDEESEPSDNYSDDGEGIDDYYQIGPFPGIPMVVNDHLGADLRVRGNGALSLTASDMDDARTLPLPTIPLQAAPSQRYFRAVPIQSEGANISMTSGAVPGSYFILSALRWLYRPFAVRT